MRQYKSTAPALLLAAMTLAGACALQAEETPAKIRIATFNIRELMTRALTDVDENGRACEGQEQLWAATKIIQSVRPDILVINEIDHDYSTPETSADLALNVRRLASAYLNQGDGAIEYPYFYAAPCNTGILSGHDLDNDGTVATKADEGSRSHGNDCYGYGSYPGQYSMGVLSRFPIETDKVRTFQKFLWKDLPGNHIPPGYYSDEELEIFRLSSKSHWDVPVKVGGRSIHLLLSHPTPPVFDGAEDKNGRRNYDEIKFWVHYLAEDEAIYDDEGHKGGPAPEDFVIAGDLNASLNSDEMEGLIAIKQLLDHSGIQDYEKLTGVGTADFGGGMRVDYLLASPGLNIVDGGVFNTQAAGEELKSLPRQASDHRLIWIEVDLAE